VSSASHSGAFIKIASDPLFWRKIRVFLMVARGGKQSKSLPDVPGVLI
jgi:hypothetical protein